MGPLYLTSVINSEFFKKQEEEEEQLLFFEEPAVQPSFCLVFFC